jgi:hypothetical protein
MGKAKELLDNIVNLYDNLPQGQKEIVGEDMEEIKRILGYTNKKGEEQCKKGETYTK